MTQLTADIRPDPEHGIQRDRWKRPLCPSPLPDGPLVAHTRASSAGSILDDPWGIFRWDKRISMHALAQRPDLCVLAASADPETTKGKKTLDDIGAQCKELGGGSKGANIGTALHAYVEQINSGETPNVLPNHQPAIDAYRRMIDAHKIEPVMVEQFVVMGSHRIAGTADIIGNVGGRLCVLDVKTGQNNPAKYSIIKVAVQFAAYANASHTWDGATAEPLPEIDTERAYLIWLPSGGSTCELIEVDIGKGLRWLDMAMEVKEAHRDRTAARALEVADAHKDKNVGSRVVPSTHAEPASEAAPDTEKEADPGPARASTVTALPRNPQSQHARVGELRRRIKRLTEQQVITVTEVKKLMAETPEAVPLTKPDEQTPQSLDWWQALVELHEMALDPADRIPDYIERLAALPVDLLDHATTRAKELDPPVPNLTTNKVTAPDLDRLETVLSPIEAVHAERVATVTQALSWLNEDEAGSMIEWACEQRGEMFGTTIPIATLDNLETERVLAICETYRHDDISAALKTLGPARDVLAAARRLAEAHDLPTPKSGKAVASDRVLAGLVLTHSTESR